MTASAPLNFDGTSTVPGGFRVRGVPERIIGWDRIGEFAHRPVGLPPEETPGLEATVCVAPPAIVALSWTRWRRSGSATWTFR